MGIGAALQQIGNMYLQRNWQKQDQQKQAEQAKANREADFEEWKRKQEFLARLGAPEERVRQVYDEQVRNAMAVREQWDPDSRAWKEVGRDAVPPPASQAKFEKYRVGDEEVAALVDPTTGTVKELGRGNAFSPSQRRGRAAIDDEDGVAERRPAEGSPAFTQSKAEATRQQEEAKALGQNAKTIVEKAQGARETLGIIGEMEKLMSGGLSTGPVDQYLPGKDRQRFDVLQKQLVGPVIKSMFGSSQLSEGDRKAAEASLPGLGRYEDVNKDVLAQMRQRAESAIAAEADLKRQQGGGEAVQAQSAPAQKSPYPDGTRLRGPDGVYEVRNGVPVKVQ